ncbi:Bud site selection protein, Revert to axial protein 1 [Podila epigama]|nr:Bud site selection protein, Revert to axial protein 1 [Podila epigama]
MSSLHATANTTSSVSISTGSSQSRKPQLEAIQTQRAQASVSFRPVSSTSSGSYYDSSSSAAPGRPMSNVSIGPDNSNAECTFQVEPEVTSGEQSLKYAQNQDPFPPSSTLSSFPFTPSTLVDSVPSPVESEQRYSPALPKPYENEQEGHPSYRHNDQHTHHTEHSCQISSPSLFREGTPQSQQQYIHAYVRPQKQEALHQSPPTSHLRRSANSTYKQQQRTSSVIMPTQQYNENLRASQGLGVAQSTSSDESRSQHLPNLWQVLNRKTLPPVCLFNFYLYMRDFEKSSEEVDFWLDVTAHEVLWRLYVRATKRRAALAAAERAAEREELEALRAAQIEAERWKSEVDEDQEQETFEKGHQQKSSVNLDMYEPHWSAANRFLEMASEPETHAIQYNDDKDGNSIATKPNTNSNYNQHYSYNGIETISLQQAHSPKTPLSPSCTLNQRSHYQHHPGAIPSNWDTAPSSSIMSAKGSSSKGMLKSARGDIMGSNGSTAATLARATKSAEGKSAAALKRMSMAGVSREDLFRSAERIYYKYLIPQAEKRVRIPGSVRHKVAIIMDGKIKEHMNHTDDSEAVMQLQGDSGGSGVGSSGERYAVQPDTQGSASCLSLSPSQHSTLASGRTSKPALAPQSAPKHKISTKATPPISTSHYTTNEKIGGSKDTALGNSNSTLFSQPDQDLGLVFAEAREIVFEGMESYYFPRFLRARAYGNIVYTQRLLRLILGLSLLFVGFTTALCLIFLNVQPQSTRAWSIIPIFFGVLLCTSFQYNICPLLVLMQASETKWMQFAKIKEPYIMLLHRRRGLKVMVIAFLVTTCTGLFFGLLPGHRL